MKEYVNLDLEAFDYQVDSDGTERFSVRVEDSPVVGQRRSEAEEVKVPSDLRRRVRRLEKRSLTGGDIHDLGTDLAALLFPPAGAWVPGAELGAH